VQLNHFSGCGARWKAFTLLEVLVTVAVIAILAVLLLTSVGRAKNKAKETVCLNNLKQVGLGLALYLGDNSQTLPLRVSQKGSTGAPPLPNSSFFDYRFFDWALGGADPNKKLPTIPRAKERPLFPYIQQFETFHCPFDSGAYLDDNLGRSKPSLFANEGCSYWYNVGVAFSPAPLGFEGVAGKSISTILSPSRFFLLYEAPAKNDGTMHNAYWHASKKAVSMLIFADFHAGKFDFSALRANSDSGPSWINK
jgi:prepilin-type N-terminal cleavage/methylation domain-containing protein